MTVLTDDRLQRFLAPKYVRVEVMPDAVIGRADTPAADAVCELHVRLDGDRIVDMHFALFGPPVAVICADWLCEYAIGQQVQAVRQLTVKDVQEALALTVQERYAALLVLDAFADAMVA